MNETENVFVVCSLIFAYFAGWKMSMYLAAQNLVRPLVSELKDDEVAKQTIALIAQSINHFIFFSVCLLISIAGIWYF